MQLMRFVYAILPTPYSAKRVWLNKLHVLCLGMNSRSPSTFKFYSSEKVQLAVNLLTKMKNKLYLAHDVFGQEILLIK